MGIPISGKERRPREAKQLPQCHSVVDGGLELKSKQLGIPHPQTLSHSRPSSTATPQATGCPSGPSLLLTSNFASHRCQIF